MTQALSPDTSAPGGSPPPGADPLADPSAPSSPTVTAGAAVFRGVFRADELLPDDYVHDRCGYRVLRCTSYPNHTVHVRGWHPTAGEIGATYKAGKPLDVTRLLVGE